MQKKKNENEWSQQMQNLNMKMFFSLVSLIHYAMVLSFFKGQPCNRFL